MMYILYIEVRFFQSSEVTAYFVLLNATFERQSKIPFRLFRAISSQYYLFLELNGWTFSLFAVPVVIC